MMPELWAALSGLESFGDAVPRALPWAIFDRAFGAEIFRSKGAPSYSALIGVDHSHFGAEIFRSKGAPSYSALIGVDHSHFGAEIFRSKGAPSYSALIGVDHSPFGAEIFRPKGAHHASPGQRPGTTATHSFPALKGRPNA